MGRSIACLLASVLLASAGYAEEPVEKAKARGEAAAQERSGGAEADSKVDETLVTAKGEKLVSGMSIVGNDEAPKSLVIVPWKSSQLGNTLDVSRALDDGRGPVDREVFMRQLTYYEIRTGQAEP